MSLWARMAVVWLEWQAYSGWHPMSKGTWDCGVVKVIKREKTSHCASHGMEMQKTLKGHWHSRSCTLTIHSASTLPNLRACSKLWSDSVFGTVYEIYLVFNHLSDNFSQSVKFTDINSCTVTAVHPSSNTYHVVFPEISLALYCRDHPADPLTTCIPLSGQKEHNLKKPCQVSNLDQL